MYSVLNFGLSTLSGFVGNSLGGLLPIWFGALAGVSETATLAYRLALGSMAIVSIAGIFPLIKLTDSPQNQQNAQNFFINIKKHGLKINQIHNTPIHYRYGSWYDYAIYEYLLQECISTKAMQL